MPSQYLGIYLNDHLAVLTGAEELVDRSLQSNSWSPLGEFLAKVLDSVKEDRTALEKLMAERDVKENWAKTGGAWLAERVGRLKLNGELTGYSPLSRLVEIEGIGLALEAKRAFWSTLSDVGVSEAGGSPTEELASQSKSHIQELESHRRAAAEEALGTYAPASESTGGGG